VKYTFDKHRGEVASALNPIDDHILVINKTLKGLEARSEEIKPFLKMKSTLSSGSFRRPSLSGRLTAK
jgi:hypothetical protein